MSEQAARWLWILLTATAFGFWMGSVWAALSAVGALVIYIRGRWE